MIIAIFSLTSSWAKPWFHILFLHNLFLKSPNWVPTWLLVMLPGICCSPCFPLLRRSWKKAQPIIGLTDEWGAGQPDFHRHRQNRHRGNFFQQNRHCWQDFQQSACSEWLAGILTILTRKMKRRTCLLGSQMTRRWNDNNFQKSNDTALEWKSQ